MEPIYKFLRADMTSPIGVSDPWEIGRTVRVDGPLAPCENGLHGWPAEGLINFTGERLFIARIGGECGWHGEGTERKLIAREMTLVYEIEAYNERTLRLFAADCAERVLPLFDRERPDDDRPRRAIDTARRFANGEATREELAAARAAAWAAAGDAAWDAAGAAAWDAARAAAWVAAGAAARDAAWAVSGHMTALAGDAERQWQARRLAGLLGLEVAS